MIKIGAVGSVRGCDWDEKSRSEIVQIFIAHDDEINSIQFQYAENGALVLSEKFGQATGYQFDVVRLNHPSEYITKISGHVYDEYDGHLASITFGTNEATYGPFGKTGGEVKEFCFQLGQDRQFGGFHGTADHNVKSIGVYLKPITILDSMQQERVGPSKNEKVGSRK